MSLAHAAEHLKQHGRGPDTELVHMSKKEIKGLQELAMAHGGSLTINPHTGLPEAGFLDNLLPTIIGVGLSVASGGALTPLMAAGITGAGYGLATGDLNKGLMAGLGAYGGAGLGAGLTSAGAAAADTAATTATNQAATNIGGQAANLGTQTAQTAGLDAAGQKATEEAFRQQAIDQGGNAVARASAPAATDIGGNLTQAGQGLSSLGGEQGRSAFMSGMSNKAPYALPALGFSAVNAAAPEQKVPGTPGPDQYDKRLAGYRLSPDYKAYEAPRPNPYYSAQYAQYAEGGITGMPPQTNFANPAAADMGTSQYDMPIDPMNGNIAQRMAEGGIAGYRKGGHLSASASIPDTGIYSDSDLTTRGEQALGASNAKLAQLYKRAGLKYAAGPKSGIEKLGGGFSEAAAGGGLSHLGGYSDGGRMLKGPGDGMSDDIPAMIGKKQPARLADGEFVVPADVVSHLGNGSTDAGAKKLYGMMDKIRKARTGRKAQGKQINPNKFIPA